MKSKYIENIAHRVRLADARAAVIYAKTDGKLYKWLKFLYIASMAVNIIMALLYVLSRSSTIDGINATQLEIKNHAILNAVNQSITIMSIVAGVWLIASVLIKFKLEIISALLTISSGVVAFITLHSASKNTAQFNEGVSSAFWFRHFLPIALAVFFIIWMLYIKLREKYRFKIAYNNMVGRIYEQYHTDDLSEEDWEIFLTEYDPRVQEEKRRREKKSKNFT